MAKIFWYNQCGVVVNFPTHGATTKATNYCTSLDRFQKVIRWKRPGFLPERSHYLFHENTRSKSASDAHSCYSTSDETFRCARRAKFRAATTSTIDDNVWRVVCLIPADCRIRMRETGKGTNISIRSVQNIQVIEVQKDVFSQGTADVSYVNTATRMGFCPKSLMRYHA